MRSGKDRRTPAIAGAAALALLLGGLPPVHSQPAQPAQTYLASCAEAGVQALQEWYVQETGRWQTTNWWNAANATTVLVRYLGLGGPGDLKEAVENTFARNLEHDFLNEYYDDEGWWALAWLDAYEWSHDTRYRDMAARIFDDMKLGWDDTCSGGIWWRKDKRYKNAIANELFLSVAARLAAAGEPRQRAAYLDWARREWQWFSQSGMINAKGLVNDGLTAACQNNGRNTWSYNQGVILGGLTALAGVTGEKAPLERAQSIAEAAIGQLTDGEGILHDTCEPKCGNDAVQFKGIFARNLGVLNAAAPAPRFRAFLMANAERICAVQNPGHRFGVVWSKSTDTANAATQVSALDAILAARGARASGPR